ncbi:Uncharacterized protein dnl_17290 [Desulfonema limicola]|uniref:Uncharacterized protein n=1 Tax=Desulfonema limicola TaxID=45656 RepID=A0A975B633_9BACT|nr:hypothetical protein [Desulfonema limicola]QTA79458.1 Uncharacterized protein dnl_17290 [Desulfonema limicola]
MTDSIKKNPDRQRDPDIANSEKAMRRAAMAARKKAYQFGHGIIIIHNGKIMDIPVDKDLNLLYEKGVVIKEL